MSGPKAIETVLDYAIGQETGINLKEVDPEAAELKHQKIITNVPEVAELDKLLFNELIGMIGGEKTEHIYNH